MGISIETIGSITQKHFIFYEMLHFQHKGFESQNDSRTLDFAICLFRQSMHYAERTIYCQHVHSNVQFRQFPDDLHGFQRYGNDALDQFQRIFRVVHGVGSPNR